MLRQRYSAHDLPAWPAEAQGAVKDRLQELQVAVQNAGCDD